ncbi:hypothetical protein G3A1_052 [Escherichia phage vB_EcoP-G3A1]|uniref:Uncharacterized protein n=1 Tax=Escherichia phage vB_EcoP-101117UKE2 TaxID=2865796 RepID=A0AAE7XRW7_9CAUD|nr:hypothetical protein 101117UKE2_052 [Escherichia phage vB_EcoP-101117UKE2]QZI79678.1 hypothetical protein 101118B1_053 [Escherichia phage vB_EcoP-101118B1]QZI81281.1 hypothetical protein G3A1_052 [Escherichia phage vB_EcoP-G3A1]
MGGRGLSVRFANAPLTSLTCTLVITLGYSLMDSLG